MADDEEELTFEQMMARVAGPQGMAALLPRGADGQIIRMDLDDALETLARPEGLAIILRDIDDNDDKQLTRLELAKFYREFSLLLKNDDTRDAQGKTVEGAPMQRDIDALLAQLPKAPDEAQYQARVDAAATTEEKQAVAREYLEALMPRAPLLAAIGGATAFLEERLNVSQVIAQLPQAIDQMAEDMDPEQAASLRAAYTEIARYNFVRTDGHIDMPTLEEVFPNNPPAAATTEVEPKTR